MTTHDTRLHLPAPGALKLLCFSGVAKSFAPAADDQASTNIEPCAPLQGDRSTRIGVITNRPTGVRRNYSLALRLIGDWP